MSCTPQGVKADDFGVIRDSLRTRKCPRCPGTVQFTITRRWNGWEISAKCSSCNTEGGCRIEGFG